MVNTAIVGCNGKMGCFVAQAVQSREDCNVLFGVDAFGESNYDFDVFKTFDEATETPDVIIDFSNPAALDGMLSYAVDNKVPCVICTTGFSKDQIAKIEDAAKTIPVFYSGNMSLGIFGLFFCLWFIVLIFAVETAFGTDVNSPACKSCGKTGILSFVADSK